MSKLNIRFIGLTLICISLILFCFFEDDMSSFLMAMCFGAGIVFVITGRINSETQKAFKPYQK